MQFAIINGNKTKANPNCQHGLCPLCEKEVIPKCGDINIWHWAHKVLGDCDTWSEGESMWHIDWKNHFHRDHVEIKIGNHRADIYNKQRRLVIELQHSSISSGEIQEREQFYKNMIWMFDARAYNLEIRPKNNYSTFRWKHPRKSIWACKCHVFFDLGYKILKVNKIYHNVPCGGSGYLIDYEDFFKQSYFVGMKVKLKPTDKYFSLLDVRYCYNFERKEV